MKNIRMDGGWKPVLIGWITSSILFPFLPEITDSALYGTPMRIFGFPAMEYISTIGFWAVIFLVVWIPAGFTAVKIQRNHGKRPVHWFVAAVFLGLLIFMEILFNFFWNS